MSRISGRFAELAASGKRAVIPYVVAGDPRVATTVPLMHALVRAGADIIELGVPFSDPMAEGPVIQVAHERALANHVSLRQVLAMVGEFRQQDQDTPILLMGYANPVLRMGYAEFAEAAAEVGLDALLTVDMPPEEVADLNAELKRFDMDNIFLVSPTTSLQRVEKIAELASGFVYYVSLKGVTGAATLDPAEVAVKVRQIRELCQVPVAVGFGIKDAATAASIATVADGVVVGSALVQIAADTAAQGGSDAAVAAAAAELVAGIRAGVDAAVGS